MPNDDFKTIFERVKRIYRQFEGKGLDASINTENDFILGGPVTPATRGREMWFGGVQIKKNYVSCHLMSVYAFPELLDGISPGLKKRMQGKSCFNFKTVDETLFTELESLAKKGYERFKAEKMIL
jgi:hypothetical protein